MKVDLSYGTFELPEEDKHIWEQLQVPEGFWDPDLKPFLDRYRPGQVAMDVGAHVGLYTLYLASRGVRVWAFERHPVYTEYLGRNLEKNERQYPGKITWLPYFLYSKTVHLEEVNTHTTRASNTWVPTPNLWGQRADVLDHFWRGGEVNLLKIDAQGADLHVLLGAEHLIQANHPDILLEYEQDLALLHGHTAADYERWIQEHGYVKTPINGWNAFLQWSGHAQVTT